MFYALARGIVWIVYHIIFKITTVGRENIPAQKGGYIIASNHVSNNDPPVLGITFKGKYTFMAKEELFKNPLFAWLIRSLGAFPVKRGSKDTAAIDKAIQSLEKGRIFMIFPEGTRSKTGELGRAKSGVAIIAARAKVPVVPVFVKYGRKKFRRNIYVSIGTPLPAERFDINLEDKHELKSLCGELMDNIAALKENAAPID